MSRLTIAFIMKNNNTGQVNTMTRVGAVQPNEDKEIIKL